jgi:mRNA interferase RelE/StbE
MKQLVYTATAARQLRKLPTATRERIIAKLHLYAETGAGDVTALRGSTGARLRVGDWRVLFDQTAGEISVRTVGHRRDSYRA